MRLSKDKRMMAGTDLCDVLQEWQVQICVTSYRNARNQQQQVIELHPQKKRT